MHVQPLSPRGDAGAPGAQSRRLSQQRLNERRLNQTTKDHSWPNKTI